MRALLLGMMLALGAAVGARAQAPGPVVTLRAIILLDRADEARAGGWGTAEGIDLSRLPALQGTAVSARLGRLLGRPIAAETLGGVREAVQTAYQQIGRPFVAVTTPAQDVSDGTLQVVVTEARLGRVRVEGNRWFAARQYENAIRLAPGGPIDTGILEADTAWLNRSPFRHADIVAEPGAAVGSTDLVVRAQDKLPLAAHVGVDNTGTRSSDETRVSAGMDWGNAFGRGDDLSYNLQASPDLHRLQQHSVSYTANLPWRDTLALSGSYARTHAIPSGLIENSGTTWNAAARYTHELPGRAGLRQSLSGGFDFKSSNNDILFGGTSVFPTTSEVDQFTLDYSLGLEDRFGSTDITLDLVGSPGGLTALNTDHAFAAQQQGARARYAYLRLGVQRLTHLPVGIDLAQTLTAQATSGILLASEQLGFGGHQSIRGLAEQGVTRDMGVLLHSELRAPAVQTGVAGLLGLSPEGDMLTGFVFLDGGVGRNQHEVVGTRKSDVGMLTAGPGLSWQVSTLATLRLSWGFVLATHGQGAARQGAQFGVQVGF